jgi:hypothetical protein
VGICDASRESLNGFTRAGQLHLPRMLMIAGRHDSAQVRPA